MICQKKFLPLLSPPTSPRMSGTSPGHPNASWQDCPPQRQRASIQVSKGASQSLTPINEASRRQHTSSDRRPVLLRSHKSFPYSSGPGAYNVPHHQSPLSRTTEPSNLDFDETVSLSQPRYAEMNRSDPVL